MNNKIKSIVVNSIDAIDIDINTLSDDCQIHDKCGTLSLMSFKEEQQRMIERRKIGRYRINEAAEFIHYFANENYDLVLKKLKQAIIEKELKSYAPNELLSLERQEVFDSWDEVYWNDLNQWISNKESLITWRFAEPVLCSLQTQVNEVSTVNKLQNRNNVLDAEINLAKKTALNQNDPSSVWTELIKIAEKQDISQKGCLICMDEKDIKYFDGNDVKFFSKKNLSDRMSRKLTR